MDCRGVGKDVKNGSNAVIFLLRDARKPAPEALATIPDRPYDCQPALRKSRTFNHPLCAQARYLISSATRIYKEDIFGVSSALQQPFDQLTHEVRNRMKVNRNLRLILPLNNYAKLPYKETVWTVIYTERPNNLPVPYHGLSKEKHGVHLVHVKYPSRGGGCVLSGITSYRG